jgi:hypothetical protein
MLSVTYQKKVGDYQRKKGKAIPVTGRRGPLGCETPRLQHFLHNRFTDGGEVLIRTSCVSFKLRGFM